MGSHYLISRKWALTSRFTITDDSGAPQFEVQGRPALTSKLSVCDTTGTEVAFISRKGLSRCYQILARRPGEHRGSPGVPRQEL